MSEKDAPEIPLPSRNSTLLLRVMPDDNSCLFRAFGTAILPGDDSSMVSLLKCQNRKEMRVLESRI